MIVASDLLNKGGTSATFNCCGNMPVVKDWFTVSIL